jgi:hypothetical protein
VLSSSQRRFRPLAVVHAHPHLVDALKKLGRGE